MSNGNQHDHDPLPVVLAGGLPCGSLKGGRHICSMRRIRLCRILLLAVLDKLGVKASKHGDSTGLLESVELPYCVIWIALIFGFDTTIHHGLKLDVDLAVGDRHRISAVHRPIRAVLRQLVGKGSKL